MKVLVQTLRFVNVKKSAIQRIAKAEREGLCMACMGPAGGRMIRGCHERCQKAIKRVIAAGKATDEELVLAGKWAAAQPGGRPPSNPISIEYGESA